MIFDWIKKYSNLFLTLLFIISISASGYTYITLQNEISKKIPDCVPIYQSGPTQLTVTQEITPCIEGRPGSEGDKGAEGERGDRGKTGQAGSQGPQGLQGEPGNIGPIGPKGDTGEKGEKGDDGDTGPAGPSGPAGTLQLTYGSFYDTTDQTNPIANIQRTVTYNSIAEADGVSIVSGSKIKVSKSGVYNIQFSIQLFKSDGGMDFVDFWLAKNNNNIDDTNTRITMIDKDFYNVAAWNYVVSANAGDEFELRWSSADINVQLHTSNTFTNPVRPRIPAVILTVVQIK